MVITSKDPFGWRPVRSVAKTERILPERETDFGDIHSDRRPVVALVTLLFHIARPLVKYTASKHLLPCNNRLENGNTFRKLRRIPIYGLFDFTKRASLPPLSSFLCLRSIWLLPPLRASSHGSSLSPLLYDGHHTICNNLTVVVFTATF